MRLSQRGYGQGRGGVGRAEGVQARQRQYRPGQGCWKASWAIVMVSPVYSMQVLLREPNPGIEFEFWLPRERYDPFQAQAQALGWSLRQPQPREVEPRPPEPPASPVTPAPGEVVRTRQGRGEGWVVVKPGSLTAPPLQTPAHPARTPEGAPTGYSTIVTATSVRALPTSAAGLCPLSCPSWRCPSGHGGVEAGSVPAPPPQCSRPGCWAAVGTPRRHATRCAWNASTRAVGRCGAVSTCGRPAAAPARRWPPTTTTCSRCGALSAPTAPRTGCSCPSPATPGPGALPRTAEPAWLPGAVPPEPPSQQPRTHRVDAPSHFHSHPGCQEAPACSCCPSGLPGRTLETA